jgi:hypothetical protein
MLTFWAEAQGFNLREGIVGDSILDESFVFPCKRRRKEIDTSSKSNKVKAGSTMWVIYLFICLLVCIFYFESSLYVVRNDIQALFPSQIYIYSFKCYSEMKYNMKSTFIEL